MLLTALQTSAAYGSSVPVKLSGLYSNRQFVSGCLIEFSKTHLAPSSAIFFISFFEIDAITSLPGV